MLLPAAVLVLTVSLPAVMSGLPGGFSDQNATDPKYKSLAWRGVPALNKENNGEFSLVPIKVLSVKTQVVAGSNTKMQVLVGQSNCKTADAANSPVTEQNCQLKEGGDRAIYEITVWEKPWENFSQFTVKKVRDVAANEQL